IPMKTSLFLGLCLAACVGVAGLWVARASEAKSARGFSLASLKGEYIYALDGFTVQSDHPVHQPFVWAGKETYDGAGHVAGVFSASYIGEFIRRIYPGTYTVIAVGRRSMLLQHCYGIITLFNTYVHTC